VFDFHSDPRVIKSVILTAQLRRDEEELLLNRFGPRYLQTCKDLLSLNWMRTPEVSGTLRRVFNVQLATTEPGPPPPLTRVSERVFERSIAVFVSLVIPTAWEHPNAFPSARAREPLIGE